MTNEDPNAPAGSNPPRRSPRQGIGGSPVGSTVSIVLAVVAVVAGFLILRNITSDDGGGSTSSGPTTGSTMPDPADSTATTTPTTTEPQMVTEGATVIVANASGVSQSAGKMTTELEDAGFTMGDATNSTSSGFTASVVHYDPAIAAAKAVADSVALSMGGLTVEELPDPIPVDGDSIGDAGVLVLLGTNEAGKSLEQLAPSKNVSAPNVSGNSIATEEPATETTTG